MKIASLITFFIVFSILFSIISFSVQSFVVGVSPGLINLGDVEKGSTKLVDFYITTPSEETILVKLETENGNLDFFSRSGYKDFVYNYSEEGAAGWVKVINNPVEIKPSNDTLAATGGLIRGREKISFILDIPKDAEPGYHVISVKPTPSAPSETIGTVGSQVVAITGITVVFNIPGEAIRKGLILDMETGNYVGNRLEIKTYFQNTGTTTISARATQRIYNESGDVIAEIYSGKGSVKPKGIITFITYMPTNGLDLGNYNAYTVVDYATGKSEKSSTIKLTAPPPTALAAKPEEASLMPLIIIFVIIVIIVSIIIYRRVQ
jgi:hypothetical protein